MQVVKLVDSEHVNKYMVQNSSPTCKHNLFALIQSKKFLVFGFGHVGIYKKSQEVQIALCPSELEKVGVIDDTLNMLPSHSSSYTKLFRIKGF